MPETYSHSEPAYNIANWLLNNTCNSPKLNSLEVLLQSYTYLNSAERASALLSNIHSTNLIKYAAIYRPDAFQTILTSDFFGSMSLFDKQKVVLEKVDLLEEMLNFYSPEGDKILAKENKITFFLQNLASPDNITLLYEILTKPTNSSNIPDLNKISYLAMHYPKIVIKLFHTGSFALLTDAQKKEIFFQKDVGIFYVIQKWQDPKVSEADKNVLIQLLLKEASYDYDLLRALLFNDANTCLSTANLLAKNLSIFNELDRSTKANLIADYIIESCRNEFYATVNFREGALKGMALFDWQALSLTKQNALREALSYLIPSPSNTKMIDFNLLYGSSGIFGKLPFEEAISILAQQVEGTSLASAFMRFTSRQKSLLDIVNKAEPKIKSEIIKHVLNDFSKYSREDLDIIKTSIPMSSWSLFKDSQGFSLQYLFTSCGLNPSNTSLEGKDTPIGFRLINHKHYQEFTAPQSKEVIVMINGEDTYENGVSVLHSKGFNILFFSAKFDKNLVYEDIFEGIQAYKQTYPDHKIKMLIINTHGHIIETRLGLDYTSTTMGITLSNHPKGQLEINLFLQELQKVHAEPLDFIMSSCKGQLASDSALKTLQIGSRFLALGEYNTHKIVDTADINYQNIWKNLAKRQDLDKTKINAESILHLYLTSITCPPSSPTYFEVKAQDDHTSLRNEAIINKPLNIDYLANKIATTSHPADYITSHICHINSETDMDNFYIKRCKNNLESAWGEVEKHGLTILTSENLNQLRSQSQTTVCSLNEQYAEHFTNFGNLLAIKEELMNYYDNT